MGATPALVGIRTARGIVAERIRLFFSSQGAVPAEMNAKTAAFAPFPVYGYIMSGHSYRFLKLQEKCIVKTTPCKVKHKSKKFGLKFV